MLLLPQAAWSKALHPASILRSVCLADIVNQPRSSFSETRITRILIMNSSISELLNPDQSWSFWPGNFPCTFVLRTFKHTGIGTKTPCADHLESPIGKQELMWARLKSCKVLWDEFVELLVQWDIICARRWSASGFGTVSSSSKGRRPALGKRSSRSVWRGRPMEFVCFRPLWVSSYQCWAGTTLAAEKLVRIPVYYVPHLVSPVMQYRRQTHNAPQKAS
jgi:hypothetical protein